MDPLSNDRTQLEKKLISTYEGGEPRLWDLITLHDDLDLICIQVIQTLQDDASQAPLWNLDT